MKHLLKTSVLFLIVATATTASPVALSNGDFQSQSEQNDFTNPDNRESSNDQNSETLYDLISLVTCTLATVIYHKKKTEP